MVLATVFIVEIKGECNGDPNAEPGCKSSFCHQRCHQATDDCDQACEPGGCRCVGRYKYDTNIDKCVPPYECSLCDGDPNAEPGCRSNFCGQRCFQTVTRYTCPHACFRGGCRCTADYKYDTNLKKCVLPELCTYPMNPEIK
ncbi:hypothetical protein ABMA27_012850 [Loxostege sticticalis]|uniref:Uncharacterized protein n=1 Tax=Loxostege sticticalis TaxID=481309 RepID=A0ABR3H047_LOXSC